MSVTVSIGETEVITALRKFILSLIDCEVIQAFGNDVPPPACPYIALQSLGATRLSTTVVTYRDGPTLPEQVARFEQPMGWKVQVDCYGPQSNMWATAIRSTLITACAVQQMASANVAPLTVSEARHLPIVNSEAQYERRWSFDVSLQIKPVVALPQQFADNAIIELISVDERYPDNAGA